MEDEGLQKVSKRLGITSRDILEKAAEFQRLLEVRNCSLPLTSMAKPVICLEIAAHSSQVPVDKRVAIRLSGMNKKSYIDAFKIIECLLEQQKEFTISDLAVQFGCMEASNLGQRIYESYKKDVVQDLEEMSQSIFVGTALYTACRHQKIKIDKTKLLNALGAKRSTFDSLHKKMEKIIPSLESDQAYSLKQQKTGEDDSSTEDIEYEKWKQRIIESATKALSAEMTSKETTNS
ncbi:PREDICTED: origin recognition complex subunit 6-like [Acropora digitifera]|uniref:origin recognition complex subunit 6-like n=1 Tax=Acropora digitifera TaxID=70779 RepID=UPI00077B1CF3|nr:PREDICTED: origin recognition complex subunit 6-like [Acropora digitifera]